MRNLFLVGAAAAAIALSATSASAQDGSDEFSGFYVGGAVTYDFQGNDPGERIAFDRNLDGTFGDQVSTDAGADAFSPGFCDGRAQSAIRDTGCENDRSRVSGAARVGFDVQRGNLVFGLVGEVGKANTVDFVSAFSTTPASYTISTRMDWNASLRARAGYAANTTLFYVTGGGAYADLDSRFETSNTANSFTPTGGEDAWGYTAGGGLEQKISKNISVGVEYLWTDLKMDDYTVRVGRGTALATNPFVLAPNTTGTDLVRSGDRLRFHSARAVVAFRF
ncbi:outer membrane protein [Sphingomonas sp.]|jgi:outer membrane immunogenic protein|uniref:outer membrane protein n=1 Tax=Sphingomonas sp. TaxID=28214 RepID=UPI002E154807|nr:outer membrane beta-barrel protein [Sphingomonas sp.]